MITRAELDYMNKAPECFSDLERKLAEEIKKLTASLCEEGIHRPIRVVNPSKDNESVAEFSCENCGKILRVVAK